MRLKTRKGSESVETALVSIGLLLIAAVIIVLFTFLFSTIYNVLANKEKQGTQESFNLLVAKLADMDKGLMETAHAYYTQEDYHLFGFNEDYNAIEARDGSVQTPDSCNGACICMCNDELCKGKIVDCNSATDNRKIEFANIGTFVVKNDDAEINQGGMFQEMGAGSEYLAIYGKWGGAGIGCTGLGVHCWKQGTIIYLERKGDVIEIRFRK